MAEIDALIANRVVKPSGIVSGEVPVWNGSSWARSSVTRIGPSSLGSGTPSSTNFLRGDGTWAAAGITGYSTSLPGSPTDGTAVVLVDSTTAPTYYWLLRYNSGSSSSYKWECIGGTPAIVVVTTAQTTSSTSYAALGTAGPSFTVPNAGDWIVTVGSVIRNSTGTNTAVGYHSFDIGGTGAVDANGAAATLVNNTSSAGVSQSTSWLTGLAASTALVSKYKTVINTQTLEFSHRRMLVIPSRIS